MWENIINFFKKVVKAESHKENSREAAKERLHLVLMQDRANVSADFLDMMKQEIIEVIKKYIDVDENAIDVKLTNKTNDDGTNGAPALYANIPIISIKQKLEKESEKEDSNKKEPEVKEAKKEDKPAEEVKQEKGLKEDSKKEEPNKEIKKKAPAKKENAVKKEEDKKEKKVENKENKPKKEPVVQEKK